MMALELLISRYHSFYPKEQIIDMAILTTPITVP